MGASSAAPNASSGTSHSAVATFDEVGPAYESAFAGLPEQAASIEWLLSQLPKSTPGKVLDIGCGTGKPVCSSLVAAGHSVLGIDISSAMLQAAREQVPEAKFEQVDVRDFSATPRTYDAITVYFSIIAGVTQSDIRASIERIHSWLKTGGLFVLATLPMACNDLEIKWMGKPLHVSSLTEEEYMEWIRKVGFEVVHQRVSTFTPKAVEAGICGPEDVWEETHLFVYAKKK